VLYFLHLRLHFFELEEDGFYFAGHVCPFLTILPHPSHLSNEGDEEKDFDEDVEREFRSLENATAFCRIGGSDATVMLPSLLDVFSASHSFVASSSVPRHINPFFGLEMPSTVVRPGPFLRHSRTRLSRVMERSSTAYRLSPYSGERHTT
jgi:hypothetical protein